MAHNWIDKYCDIFLCSRPKYELMNIMSTALRTVNISIVSIAHVYESDVFINYVYIE